MPFRFCANGVRRLYVQIFRTQILLNSRVARYISNCLLPIDNYYLIWFCFSKDSTLVATLFPLVYSTKQCSLLNEITLHVVTCIVELTNDAIHLNLFYIIMYAIFINNIGHALEKILAR